MPLYDYSCRCCQHTFDAFQHMSAPPLRKCPECGRVSLERLIGAPTIRTDATFSRGHGTLLQQFGGDEAEVQRVVSAAKRQGYTPGMYDIYQPCMADSKGDPKAFLPPSNPVGHLKKLQAHRAEAARQPIRRKPATVGAA